MDDRNVDLTAMVGTRQRAIKLGSRRGLITPLPLIIIAISLSTTGLANPCLTHSEARQRWPDAHLYWHTDARCWDNHARGANHYEPRPEVIKTAPPKVPDNWASAPQPGKVIAPDKKAEIFYPDVVKTEPELAWQPKLNWGQPWLTPASMVYWPQLIDIDRVPFIAWDKRIGGQ